MAKNDTNTLKDELKPVKDLLEIIKNKVDKMETFQNVTMQQVRDMKDQQSVINEKLDSHTGALIRIETVLVGYADMYKINKDNIVRHEKRISKMEDNLGIQTAQELIVME